LDVLKNAPHFFEYLHTLYLFDEACKTKSAKYRLLRELIIKAENKLNIKSASDKEGLSRRLRLMVDDFIMTDFFINNDIAFTIGEGQQYYDVNGDVHISTGPMRISLGTLAGQSTFKLWMEQTVIPTL